MTAAAGGSVRLGPAAGSVRARRRRPRVQLILAVLAALVIVVAIVAVAAYSYLNSKLIRINALVPAAAASAGQNWLITGTTGAITRKQERHLHTGADTDDAADTLMLLHIPANGGPPVLVSIPRDSYVPIPGYGMNKINAATSFGGARLMVRTVQDVTGLTINHYLGIGYVGLVNAVNAIGGLTMCFPHPLRDAASGIHLKKGCDTLNGKQALEFVRTRHQFATQDLQREQNQRVFIKALLAKMLSPGTLLNPFAIIPAAAGSAGALTVDQGTNLKDLIGVAFALRSPQTTTVPIANANYLTPVGDALQWDRPAALRLFHDLQTDHPVAKRLLTGSHLAG
jgi:LCP family protein required for cell wall assembly